MEIDKYLEFEKPKMISVIDFLNLFVPTLWRATRFEMPKLNRHFEKHGLEVKKYRIHVFYFLKREWGIAIPLDYSLRSRQSKKILCVTIIPKGLIPFATTQKRRAVQSEKGGFPDLSVYI